MAAVGSTIWRTRCSRLSLRSGNAVQRLASQADHFAKLDPPDICHVAFDQAQGHHKN